MPVLRRIGWKDEKRNVYPRKLLMHFPGYTSETTAQIRHPPLPHKAPPPLETSAHARYNAEGEHAANTAPPQTWGACTRRVDKQALRIPGDIHACVTCATCTRLLLRTTSKSTPQRGTPIAPHTREARARLVHKPPPPPPHMRDTLTPEYDVGREHAADVVMHPKRAQHLTQGEVPEPIAWRAPKSRGACRRRLCVWVKSESTADRQEAEGGKV
ncbi:hypothetical protein C8J57DRAFT_1308217, partial [Mycena rebaudengoi]